MSRSTVFLATCFAVSFALTACESGGEARDAQQTRNTTAPAASATTTGPGSSPAEWVNGFCGAVNGFVARQDEMPDPTGGNTIGEHQRQTGELLDHFVTTLDEAIAALDALDQPPDSTAETAARTTRDNYAAARETAATAKEELEAAAPDDVEAQNRAADGVIESQEQAHRSIDPVGVLTGSPELIKAAADAPNCK